MKPSLYRGISRRKRSVCKLLRKCFVRHKLLLLVLMTAAIVVSFVLPSYFAIPFTEWLPRSKLAAERCSVQTTPRVKLLAYLENVPWSCSVARDVASDEHRLWPLNSNLRCCYQALSMGDSRVILPHDEGRGWRLPGGGVDVADELVLTSCEGSAGSSLHFFPSPKPVHATENRAISVVLLQARGPLTATWSVLKHAEALDMDAYTQLDSSLDDRADLLATLTGVPDFDFPPRCLRDSGDGDGCPWVWRHFSAVGAATLLLEESPSVGDFATRPTDVWLRPLTALMDDALRDFDPGGGGDCPQATLRARWFGRHLRAALGAVTRGAGPYWAMVHVTATAAMDAELAGVLDDVLNQAVVFLLADKQLSVAAPKWFRYAFPDAMVKLGSNRRRSTTPFDVHETMVHLSDFVRLNDRTPDYEATQLKDVPGRSLFLTVPEWASKDETPPSPQVLGAASALASLLNRRLARKDARCKPLAVSRVVSAHTLGSDLLLVAETQPEGVVVQALMGLGDHEPGSVSLKSVLPKDLAYLCHFNKSPSKNENLYEELNYISKV